MNEYNSRDMVREVITTKKQSVTYLSLKVASSPTALSRAQHHT